MEKYCGSEEDTDGSIIWRMRIACWIPKATKTYSEYVILIASALQKWLPERTPLLRYTYFVLFIVLYLIHVYCYGKNQ